CNLRNLRSEQQRRSAPASSRTKNCDILILVAHVLPQFQCRKTEQRKDDREDPKPHDDRIFLPAGQLEVMMKRRHDENPLAREFETHHLQNHRDGFDHENAAYHNEDRKSTRLNSSHRTISYAVFCLKKKKKT